MMNVKTMASAGVAAENVVSRLPVLRWMATIRKDFTAVVVEALGNRIAGEQLVRSASRGSAKAMAELMTLSGKSPAVAKALPITYSAMASGQQTLHATATFARGQVAKNALKLGHNAVDQGFRAIGDAEVHMSKQLRALVASGELSSSTANKVVKASNEGLQHIMSHLSDARTALH